MNSEKLLDFLIRKGQAWILEQRELYRPGADRLDQATQFSLEPFFGSEILDSARFQVVPLIENPGF